MTPGTRVEMIDTGETGVVCDSRYDNDGEFIPESEIAVEVDNGQGVWGFDPNLLLIL